MANLTIFGLKFWDLWFQKMFRNIASMKFIWMTLLYAAIVIGMFDGKWVDNVWVAKIPATVGCTLLGGGFITLAGSRLIARTKLKEDNDTQTIDCDK